MGVTGTLKKRLLSPEGSGYHLTAMFSPSLPPAVKSTYPGSMPWSRVIVRLSSSLHLDGATSRDRRVSSGPTTLRSSADTKSASRRWASDHTHRSALGYRADRRRHKDSPRPCVFFFFSSRRRHTRFDCDWSSDVCSSDLRYELLVTGGPRVQGPDACAAPVREPACGLDQRPCTILIGSERSRGGHHRQRAHPDRKSVV